MLNNNEQEKDLGYQAATLMNLFKQFSSGRAPYERMWKLIQAVYDGDFWKLFSKYAPAFAIKPDSNQVSYVVDNYVNSLYVGKYIPMVFPRYKENSGNALSINEFLEYTLEKLKFTKLQKDIGESAAKFNLGAIEIGWKSEIINGPEGKFIGEIEAKQLNVMNLYLDPAVKDYLKGRAIFVAEVVPIIEILNEPKLAARMKEFLNHRKQHPEQPFNVATNMEVAGFLGASNPTSKDESVRLITCYYKAVTETGYRIDKIWMIDNGFILAYTKGIKPNTFPIRVLYCRNVSKDPYGIPVTKLILNDAITINLIDCADATLMGNSTNRPKVISRNSGINEALFAQYGDDPKRLWVVEGDPNNVLRYIDLPQLPAERYMLRQNLLNSIAMVSGVDSVYTGRDTNSVQTTGGMDILNQRVGMSDNSRILNLQDFILEVSELIMEYYISNGDKAVPYPRRSQDGNVDDIISIDFESMRNKDVHFDFTVSVSASTPMSIHKLAEKADILMEKQMQYNPQPPVMTMEEWLKYQDFPQKYHIIRRIKEERMRDDVQDVQSDIINYAGMVDQGMSPQSAINQLAQERQLKRELPGLGNTSGSTQSRQRG